MLREREDERRALAEALGTELQLMPHHRTLASRGRVCFPFVSLFSLSCFSPSFRWRASHHFGQQDKGELATSHRAGMRTGNGPYIANIQAAREK